MKNSYTLAVQGATDLESGWIEWFEFMTDASREWGAPLTHFGIRGEGLGGASARAVKAFAGIRKRIGGVAVQWLCGFSVPKRYNTIAADCNLEFSRTSDHVMVSAKEDFSTGMLRDPTGLMEQLSQFISRKKAVLFELSEDEVPLNYVDGDLPASEFESLKILKRWPVKKAVKGKRGR